ncbi:MAG: hypothetical protein SNJ52_04475 [Verrucomicrobiia bacterium]
MESASSKDGGSAREAKQSDGRLHGELVTPAVRPWAHLDVVDAFFAGFGSAFWQTVLSLLAVYLGMNSSLIWSVEKYVYTLLFPLSIILMFGEWNPLGGWMILGFAAFVVGTISAVAFAMGHGGRRLWFWIYSNYFVFAFAPHMASFTWESACALLTAIGMAGVLWGLPWLVGALAMALSTGFPKGRENQAESATTNSREIGEPLRLSASDKAQPGASD